jgi:hypothetical protein
MRPTWVNWCIRGKYTHFSMKSSGLFGAGSPAPMLLKSDCATLDTSSATESSPVTPKRTGPSRETSAGQDGWLSSKPVVQALNLTGEEPVTELSRGPCTAVMR